MTPIDTPTVDVLHLCRTNANMPFSVRLDRDTERRIDELAAAAGRSRSQIVRDAVAAYAAARDREAERTEPVTAYDRLKPYIGVARGLDPTLSQRHSEAFLELLKAKHARRSH